MMIRNRSGKGCCTPAPPLVFFRTGPRGPAGPTGPQGERGPGVPFTLFSATSRAAQTFTSQTTPHDVHFPDVLQNINTPVTMQGDTEFRINTSGFYEVNYHFSLAADNSNPFSVTYTLSRGNSFIYESDSQAAQSYETLPPTVVMLASTVHVYLFAGTVITLGWRQLGGTVTTVYTITNPYISFQRIGDIV